MLEKLKRFIDENFFPYNYTCDICGVETFKSNLCADCLKKVTFNDGATCPVCGRRTVREEICLNCKEKAPRFKKAVSPLVYEDGAVALIHKFKGGGAHLKEYFADLIADKINKLPEFDVIVPVPSTKKSVRRRGYDQTLLLAKSLEKRVKKPILRGVLIKVKQTAEQKGLTRKEREVNLKGAFALKNRKSLKGKRILLLDDVLTTGSTAEAATNKLLEAKPAAVYLATVASVEYTTLPSDK